MGNLLVIPNERYESVALNQGKDTLVVPAIKVIFSEDSVLRKFLTQLETGNADWLILTSANVVKALARVGFCKESLPQSCRVAAVGQATAQSCQKILGIHVDFVPKNEKAAGLLSEQIISGNVLLPQSSLAHTTLRDGLQLQGCTVFSCVAYRVDLTISNEVKARVQELLSGQQITAFYCTSPSVARFYLEVSKGYHDSVEFQAIGETTRSFLDSHL